jgi:hypothetical protein
MLDPEARNIKQYETILSGDLKGNDRQVDNPWELLDDPCRAENSYHVVTGSDTNSSAILDGFTITGGNANRTDAYGNGGGMYNENGSPTVTNCTFSENAARWASYGAGGGMYTYNGSPKVRNCIFTGNVADCSAAWGGGGMCNYGSNPTVTNCIFIGNNMYYGSGSGGICCSYGDANVTNCILWGNEGGQIEGGNVTYSDIQGGYTGTGNIDSDPMFVVDGYHLTLCSPCIDAGTNTPPGGMPEEDIDGEPRIIDSDCNGNARVDMGVDEYYTADCNVFLRAHCPMPNCRAADVPRDVVLCWRPGVDANKHDVYFGTDRTAVINANDPNTPPGRGRQDSNSFDPCTGLLEPNQCYCWRIDEVNDANIWRGDVWHFRTVDDNYLVVEDFNSYTGTDSGEHPLCAYAGGPWYGWENGTCAVIHVQLGIVDANFVRGGTLSNSMRYGFWNGFEPYYSEAYADIAALPSHIGPDWTANGVKALVLWFYGETTNPVSEQMYVKLHDADSNSKVVYDGNPNDVKEAEWHEWNIALHDFEVNNPSINLANVSRITIGFGDKVAPGNNGAVYFEDIRLYKRRCRPDIVAGDLDGDCAVDWLDLKIMTDKWLDMGCCEDLYKDDKVNFKDFAILADSWLVEGLWP